MNRISVCLATFNEEKNLGDCLESVKWADEIVIVDGKSTDKTAEIAGKYTRRIYFKDNPLMFHRNKQKAFDLATGEWILYLDADERVDGQLKKEILSSVKKKNYQGFWIPRKNIIFGKWIRNSFWHPDYQLRLFRKGKAFLPCQTLHEQPELTGKASYLKNSLIHYNYRTVSQYLRKISELYSENDARVLINKKKKVFWYDAVRFPVRDFLATFFARKAYRDGLHGLVLSLFQAFSSFVTFCKVWEAQGFKEQELSLDEFSREMKKLGRETSYWITTVLIDNHKQPLKKYWLKLRRRLEKVR